MASKTKHVLNVKQRAAGGSADARRLRNQGLIPAVIYSKGKASETISVDEVEWDVLSRSELHLVSLVENGKETLVLLKETQHDFIRNKTMHLDFMEVRKDQVISTRIAIRQTHAAPVGVGMGGVLDQNIHEIEVECLPDDLPESIEVDISALGLGESFHVNQILPPAGVKILTASDLVVFLVADPNAQTEEASSASAEGTAEPEVVGAKEKAEKAAAAAETKKK